MQDASYLDRIEVTDPTQQLPTLHEMIIQNNKTGFQFNPTPPSSLRSFRVYFKMPIPIALVQILTPRSNVKQIRLSYFDQNNQTIKNRDFQDWQINYISQYGRENNSLDKLCPDFKFKGIRVDLLPTNFSSVIAYNTTLKVFIRPCQGLNGPIRMLKRILKYYNRFIYFFFRYSFMSRIKYFNI